MIFPAAPLVTWTAMTVPLFVAGPAAQLGAASTTLAVGLALPGLVMASPNVIPVTGAAAATTAAAVTAVAAATTPTTSVTPFSSAVTDPVARYHHDHDDKFEHRHGFSTSSTSVGTQFAGTRTTRTRTPMTPWGTATIIITTTTLTQTPGPHFTGTGTLLHGACATAHYTPVAADQWTESMLAFIGCVADRPQCCPFTPVVSDVWPHPTNTPQAVVKSCPADYYSTSGKCCPTSFKLLPTPIAGETPCYKPYPAKITPPPKPTTTGANTVRVTVTVTDTIYAMPYHLEKKHSGLDTGVIVAIVISCIAFVGGVVGFTWWCISRRKAQHNKSSGPSDSSMLFWDRTPFSSRRKESYRDLPDSSSGFNGSTQLPTSESQLPSLEEGLIGGTPSENHSSPDTSASPDSDTSPDGGTNNQSRPEMTESPANSDQPRYSYFPKEYVQGRIDATGHPVNSNIPRPDVGAVILQPEDLPSRLRRRFNLEDPQLQPPDPDSQSPQPEPSQPQPQPQLQPQSQPQPPQPAHVTPEEASRESVASQATTLRPSETPGTPTQSPGDDLPRILPNPHYRGGARGGTRGRGRGFLRRGARNDPSQNRYPSLITHRILETPSRGGSSASSAKNSRGGRKY